MTRRIGLMRNLGPVMERRLAAIDVHTEAELRALGAAGAWARLRFVEGRRPSLIALYAMDAALDGIDWRAVAEDRKKALRRLAGADRPENWRARRDSNS